MDHGKDRTEMLKIFGVVFIIASCGGVGFQIAANHRVEERALHQLTSILEYMECELQYRLTPLPTLCRQISHGFSGAIGSVFSELAIEMEAQLFPDISHCMCTVLERSPKIPPITRDKLHMLARSMGKFDLDGQLKGLATMRNDCQRSFDSLCCNREVRLRSYQTLGLCAGAALAILFI